MAEQAVDLPDGQLLCGVYAGTSVRKWSRGVAHEVLVKEVVDWGSGEYTYNLAYEPGTFDENGVGQASPVAVTIRELTQGERVLLRVRVTAAYSGQKARPFLTWECVGITRAPRVVPVAKHGAGENGRVGAGASV